MGYQSDLEVIWREKNGETPDPFPGLEHSKRTRGSDLYMLLYELDAHLAGVDDRFGKAALALLEHGIVDRHLNFNRSWRTPIQRDAESIISDAVKTAMKDGLSIESACAHAAAHLPVHAASFKAAVKRTKRAYEELGHLVRREKSNDK